ncbi:hypothetical protein FRD01_05475 [Microvenator marinus]|uniref:YdhG-like domain-containing protein n=1 Tax=Microvenator marinus TaxID=2600177 RepID=A0A5B8XMC1_9DELT|nr:YdeI/OmpD-associated family protein [Microvenator marinus]QED26705.1 hypothetical protein FRD01_05475 [Microvenator marinus]
MNNTSVESYLAEGCGRCEHYQTPQCKVHLWTEELLALREILRSTSLDETMKWGSPCYTFDGKNVAMMGSFRDYCSISFFKGVLLEDPEGLLEAPGPNSRHARLLKFRSLEDVERLASQALNFLNQAVEIQKKGLKVDAAEVEPLPDELEARLLSEDGLWEAYEALTPGRQRSFILHVSSAKNPETRVRRAEKCVPKIWAGKGFNEY